MGDLHSPTCMFIYRIRLVAEIDMGIQKQNKNQPLPSIIYHALRYQT